MAVDVTDAPAAARFELHQDGTLVGWVDYRIEAEAYVLHHARVLPEARRHGLATQMVRAVLAQLDDRSARVIPSCSFVAWVVGRSPEYRRLVSREAPEGLCPWLGSPDWSGVDANPQ